MNDVLQCWFWFKSFNDINEEFEEVVEKVFEENKIAHDNIDTFSNRKNLEDGDLYLEPLLFWPKDYENVIVGKYIIHNF